MKFGPIEYTAPGTYTYTIAESAEGFDAWDASDAITVTVKVTDNNDGTLTATPTYSPEDQTITNSYSATGSMKLEAVKAIEGAAWPNGKTITFTLSGDGPMPTTVSYELTAPGKVTFDQIELTEADAGKTYTYTISETTGFGGAWEKSGDITATVHVTDDDAGKVSATVTYSPEDQTITNKHPVGGLAVTKKVESDAEINADQTFTFTVTLDDTTINGDYGDMTFTDGVASIELKADETATAEGLPCGIVYTVTEENIPDGYTLDHATGETGEIEAEATVEAEITNVYAATGSICFEASKILTGRTLKADEFTFLLTDANGETLQKKQNDADGKVLFDEIAYETADLNNSPITYYISEEKGTDPYITYDEHQAEITVTLTDNLDGTITAEAEIVEGELEFTNRYVRNISVAVKKVWEDDNNRDGLRPLKVTVDLLSNGTVIRTIDLTEKDSWMAVVKDLPEVDDDDNEIAYTWTEHDPGNGYRLKGTEKNGNVTVLTNEYDVKTTEVTVRKVWEDNGNAAGKRKDIRVQLYANGEAYKEEVTLSEANGWKYTWTGLEKNCIYAGASQPITYTVEETEIPEGYQAKVTGDASTEFVITNTLETGSLIIEKKFDIEEPEVPEEPETELTDITVQKVWADNNNQDGIRPASITVHLYAGGEKIDTAQLTAAGGWTHTFKDLPVTVRDKQIKYSVKEDPVPGYITVVRGFTIRNIHEPETVNIAVQKLWNDCDDLLGIRPANIRVMLSNGTTVILSEENHWMAAVTGLPKRENGEEITYTWTEQEVTGYKLTSVTVTGSMTTFTNTPIKPPEVPEEIKEPKVPEEFAYFEEYKTALGVETIINHVGDCFD